MKRHEKAGDILKQLYLIGGPMGIGKTTTGQIIKNQLSNSVFLDGDWCWDMHPFVVSDETKQMVMHNICFLLNSFIDCSIYNNIIFSWVMHEQSIIDEIISRINVSNCHLHLISLVANEMALMARLQKDIANGIRHKDVVKKSVERLPLYNLVQTHKVDVSNITPQEAAEYIRGFGDMCGRISVPEV